MNRERNTELDALSALSFAALETNLYLDGHPNDEGALRYFRDTVRALNEKTAAYEKQNGPLFATSDGNENQFLWATTPWPWQEG